MFINEDQTLTTLPTKDEVIDKYKESIKKNKANARDEKSIEELAEEEYERELAKTQVDFQAEKFDNREAKNKAKYLNKEAKKLAKLKAAEEAAQRKQTVNTQKEIKHKQAQEAKLFKKEAVIPPTQLNPTQDVGETNTENHNRKYTVVNDAPAFGKGVKGLKQRQKYQLQLTNKYSKRILMDEEIVTTQDYMPTPTKHIIELKGARKSYQTGDLETPILKGIDIQLDKGDFIVILGPSGSGKTTFLNVISGLDKATEGDVFILGSNLSLLKDSHLTKFRRKNIGFIFQQYNLLTNLTSKENAEVGQNLANKDKPGMSIEHIFETIGMTEQMHKYPHQMSGGQQQRVSIARALAKNPEILFADEPTGALDEEMGRKVLEILVKVNREQRTTIVVVTHNPNIAKIANTVIHIKNGLIDSLEKNKKPVDPQSIEWS